MKIYMPHSREFDFKNEWYAPIRASELNSKHEIIFPHERPTEFNSKETIQSADLIVAEVSFPSTGLGIELGWANSAGKKVICARKSGTKPSPSLQSVCSENFEYSGDLISKLAGKII